jgi:ferrous-iron efflux pump FieF
MLHSAYGFLSESVRDLLDGALEESLQLHVLRCLSGHFDDYRDFHGMRSRRAGSRVFIEIFLEFDGDKAMAEVQATIDRMRAEIAASVRGSSVTIAPVTQPIAASV